MNERDTHFQGFAKLLWDELLEAQDVGYGYDSIITIIAQRAYDLVRHALEQASHGEHAFDAEIIFHRQVTDLTEWPNTSPPLL